jgi:hypothetical protein
VPFALNKAYGTLINSFVPAILYAVPPVGSVSVFIKYGPFDQLIPANVPVTAVPVPISKLTNPLALVLGVWVSTYTALPVDEPCKTLIFIPTGVDVTNALLLLRITAW